MLKTSVFVGKVTNLSDARYCAAVGADFIGFDCNPSSSRYVSVELINAIIGWTAGVKTVLEFGNQPESAIIDLVNTVKPDAILIPTECYTPAIKNLNCTVMISSNSAIELTCDYLVCDASAFPNVKGTSVPVFVSGDITENNIAQLLETYKPFGIYLQGGDEIKPGIKSYDELAVIFDLLEIPD